MSGFKPYRCECNRKFKTKEAWRHHVRDYHLGKPTIYDQEQRPTVDLSIADMIINAQLDRAMGVHNDDVEFLLGWE